MKSTFGILVLISIAAVAETPAVNPCPEGAGPRAALMDYLTAMHEHRFGDAFDYVSDRMTDGRERSEWSAMQKMVYQPGKVDIYGVDIRRAIAVNGDPECRSRAVVPNILSSRDKLNVHGIVEFEIYSVIREGEGWRIDSQETLYEDEAILTWFPDAKVVEGAVPD